MLTKWKTKHTIIISGITGHWLINVWEQGSGPKHWRASEGEPRSLNPINYCLSPRIQNYNLNVAYYLIFQVPVKCWERRREKECGLHPSTNAHTKMSWWQAKKMWGRDQSRGFKRELYEGERCIIAERSLISCFLNSPAALRSSSWTNFGIYCWRDNQAVALRWIETCPPKNNNNNNNDKKP